MPETDYSILFQKTKASLERMWRFCLFLPMIYLVVCLLIQHYYFIKKDYINGLLDLSQKTTTLLYWIFGTVTVIAQLAILAIKEFTRRELSSQEHTSATALAIFQSSTYFMLALSDIVSFLGVVLFLISGRITAVFAFGVAGLVLYFQCRPNLPDNIIRNPLA